MVYYMIAGRIGDLYYDVRCYYLQCRLRGKVTDDIVFETAKCASHEELIGVDTYIVAYEKPISFGVKKKSFLRVQEG
jgi:hypothetical protein